jgi:translation initiation factor IF-1
MFDDCIPTTGIVRKTLKPGLFQIELKNGKKATAHLAKELVGAEIADDTPVSVEMTPYDFDQARIVALLPPPA